MSIEAMKLALEALDIAQGMLADLRSQHQPKMLSAYTALEEVLAEHAMCEVQRLGQEIEQEPVAFKIYKPTPPRHATPNVRDAELPWVYDQDPLSGNVASMWVTPVQTLRSKS